MVCYLFFHITGHPDHRSCPVFRKPDSSFSSTAGLKEFDVPVPDLQPTNTPEYSVKVVGWEWTARETLGNALAKMTKQGMYGHAVVQCGIYIYIIFTVYYIYLFIYQQGGPKKKTFSLVNQKNYKKLLSRHYLCIYIYLSLSLYSLFISLFILGVPHCGHLASRHDPSPIEHSKLLKVPISH